MANGKRSWWFWSGEIGDWGGYVPHVGWAGRILRGAGLRHGRGSPLESRRPRWRLLLLGGRLQLLLRVLLSSSLSSATATAAASPSLSLTALLLVGLLLLVLELGWLACRPNRAELVCSLLVLATRALTSMSLPRETHGLDDLGDL